MKKLLALVLAALLVLGMLSGCTKKEEKPAGGETSQQAGNTETSEGTASSRPEDWKTLGDILAIEGLYTNERSTFAHQYIIAFTVDGTIYRAIANLTEEQEEAIFALDIFDEKHEEKENELIAPVAITQLDNMSERILSGSALEQWIGKTGEDLLEAGWEVSGWNLYEKQFFMDYEYFEYSVIMDGELETDGDEEIDGAQAIKPMTVKKIEFDHLSNACWDIIPPEEDNLVIDDDPPEEIVAGGWMNEDIFYSIPFYELDPAAFEPLEQVKKILLGVDYEALALLGKQIVAGTNYAYLCKATVVAPDAQPYLAVVFVYQTLEGDCELLKIQPIDVGIGASEGDFLDMAVDPPAGPLMGGWTVDPLCIQLEESDVNLDEETKAKWKEAKEHFNNCEQLRDLSHAPMYCLATQVVAGMNYCYLSIENETDFYLDYVYVDLEGNETISSMRLFDYPQLND
ncbi:MAG: hypothetical protein IIY45_10800 [Firmicutes bacterium]|nr:hypothetical protein [Bacillota bacterium]